MMGERLPGASDQNAAIKCGDQIVVAVRVTNTRAGHYIPTQARYLLGVPVLCDQS